MISIADVAPTSIERSATHLLRLSMMVIFFWFGLQKFTAYEAMGIAPLVSNSPLTSWLNVLGTQGASMVVGTSELTFGVLLAIGLRWPGSLAAMLGALGSCVTFLTTLSFMVTTPGVWAPSGPPLLSGTTGVFLIKDIVLLATSILFLAQALTYRRAMVTPAASRLAGPSRLPDHSKGTEDVAAYHKQRRPL
jgi:uncharacterized membrane protein YkgB